MGYQDALDGVFELGLTGEISIEFRLQPAPLPIDALVVSFNRPIFDHPLVINGFVERFQRGLGHFITPHDIETSPAQTAAELFQGLSGVQVRPPRITNRAGTVGPGGNTLAYLGDQAFIQGPRGWCAPAFYLDGIRISAAESSSLESIVSLNTIDGIQIYRRPAEIPVEYSATQSRGSQPCGVILLWTRKR